MAQADIRPMGAPDPEARPDPDALLAQVAREGRGRLKIFLGAAPGVGKTWEMLAAARGRAADGTDVVIGVVETHGRAETRAQIGDLPVLPRRAVEYRGQRLEEMDLEAAVARRPRLILVDELAHTNAPGSRHAKRWEDVADLLAEGIDVWATLNIQHLESLNDSVQRITGVRVSETLPDRVMEAADEIEFIDLSPVELRERLRTGRVYRPEMVTRALEGFFREGNLAALREIGLRRAAQHVDDDVRDYMRRNAIAGPWPAGERVLALAGADALAPRVVRQAKRLADALHVPWVVLHVERPGHHEDARAALDLAAQLGAEIELRAGSDLVRVMLDCARARNATHLVVGHVAATGWRRLGQRVGRLLGRGNLVTALTRRAGRFNLSIVGGGEAAAPARRRVDLAALQERPVWLPMLLAALLVAATVALGEALSPMLDADALGMVFLASVVAAATARGLWLALWTALLAFLAWNFFFLPPLYQLTIQSFHDVMGAIVFGGVASATGWLASRVRREARAAQARIEGLRRIAVFSRRLGRPAAEQELLEEIAAQAAEIAGAALVLTARDEDIDIRAAMPPADTMDEGGWAAARWCLSRGEPAGQGTGTLPSSGWRFLPMRTERGMFGVLGLRLAGPRSEPVEQALSILADQAAAALERVRLAADAARGEAQAETQKLRTALLNSLSHDLRTPLTSIRGSAAVLRSGWAKLDDAVRDDLLASIEQDTVRMTQFLSNIMEMTRLETGAVVPRIVAVRAVDVVDAALARVPQAGHARCDLSPDLPLLRADPMLLEQVLVNLLDNAVKYSAAGSPLHIEARRAREGCVVLRVVDAGIGIDAADLPFVFDSFYRARRGDRIRPGTGLGLAIARGLVEVMGGSIAAESPLGARGGTAIAITLEAA